MANTNVKQVSPVVHSKRAELKTAVVKELKALGMPEPVLPKSRDECIETLIKQQNAILVIDWALGSEEVNQVLGAVRGHFKIETRPILLVIDEIETNVVAAGAEFGVSQIHAGPLAAETLHDCLKELIHEEESTTTIREVMLQVAVARGKDDWAVATPMLMELYDKMPGQERVALELAENLIYEGSWDQAEQLLAPYLTGDPPNIRALHLMGRCLMHKGEFPKAIALLEKAKIVNPHNVDRLIDLGEAFLNNNQTEAAMANFQEATTLDEENKEAKVGQGKCLLIGGEVNEALSLLKNISGPREMASIFNTAAVLTMHQGHFDKGMHLYKSALQALGRNDKIGSRLMFNMGLGYRRWHKPDKALACFSKSLELDPTYEKAAKHKELAQKGAHHAPPAAQVAAPVAAKAAVDKSAFAEEEFTNPVAGAPKRKLDPNVALTDDMNPDEWDVDD